MKKIITVFIVGALFISMLVIAASAAESVYTLLPSSADDYRKFEKINDSVTIPVEISITDGKHIIKAASHWPSAAYEFTENAITVPIEGTVLKYKFTVESGATNISVFFDDATLDAHNDKYFSIIQMFDPAKRPDDNGEPGGDDLAAGTYEGELKLSDMITNAKFPANVNIGDGTLTFSCFKVFSVSGATVTIEKMELAVPDGEDNSATSSESASSTTSEASSVTESASSSAAAVSSAAASSAASQPGTGDASANIFVLVAIALIAVAGCAVLYGRKK